MLNYIYRKKTTEQKSSRKLLQSEEEMLRNYMVSAGEVTAYLKTAIDHVKRTFEEKLSDAQTHELDNIMVSLIKPDITKLDSAVEKTEKIMLEIGLYPQ